MVGDGGIGRSDTGIRETCWSTKTVFKVLVKDRRAGLAGVRASVVARKSRNGEGAKGRREVET